TRGKGKVKGSNCRFEIKEFSFPFPRSMASLGDNIKVVEVSRVTPYSSGGANESSTDFSVPLTFFDIYWLKFPPVKRICFYKLSTGPSSTPAYFNTVILPKLKHALSLTLPHFLPLSGNLVWPPHAAKPSIVYKPKDGVWLTVAESSTGDDFDRLSSHEPRYAIESHPYVPELSTSNDLAAALSLQITLFPSKGFSIGYAYHHAALDGQSILMFMKAWAHICKFEENPSLLPELTPFLDRTVVQDPEGIDMESLKVWSAIKWPGLDPNPRSLQVLSASKVSPNIVRATFKLTRQEIKKLREKVLSQLNESSTEEDMKQAKLSTFVLAFAYTLVCIVKAKGKEIEKRMQFGFAVDCRARLDPPIPSNYFGSCIGACSSDMEVESLLQENGIICAVERLREMIEGLEKGVLEGTKKFKEVMTREPGTGAIWTAGSTRFDVYRVDFGWGRPVFTEVTTIDRTGAISFTASRDGGGGVEVGVVLNNHDQMEGKVKGRKGIVALKSKELCLFHLHSAWHHQATISNTESSSTPAYFNTVILPKLKHSLSLTLPNFLTVTGNLVWPPHAAKPSIVYRPKGGVSLTVAESSTGDDFDRLTSHEPRYAIESHPYVPELVMSSDFAAALSLQNTLFPSKGFSIGYAYHHAVLDGQNMLMFMKAWAHMCSCDQENPTLMPELTPARLDPPIPSNYFGSCIIGARSSYVEVESLLQENGIISAVEALSEKIKGLEKGVLEGAKEKFKEEMAREPGTGILWTAGSTRFDVYGVDFGWGRPALTEVTSIGRTGAVSFTASREGDGGVEKKHGVGRN
ncbi:hypothetical protein Tsubulata_003965, partial [Turnera subulata]